MRTTREWRTGAFSTVLVYRAIVLSRVCVHRLETMTYDILYEGHPTTYFSKSCKTNLKQHYNYEEQQINCFWTFFCQKKGVPFFQASWAFFPFLASLEQTRNAFWENINVVKWPNYGSYLANNSILDICKQVLSNSKYLFYTQWLENVEQMAQMRNTKQARIKSGRTWRPYIWDKNK